MSIKNPFTVIFDMDGVIFDTENIYMMAWTSLAEEKNYDRNKIRNMVLACTGTNSAETRRIVNETLGASFPFEECLTYTRNYFTSYVETNGFPIKPFAKELLTWLSENRIATGLASSTKEAVVREELTNAGLLPFFSVILGGDNVKKSKPAPDIFLACADHLGASPEHCYVIEDSFNGIRAAHAAGMHPIMVPDLRQPDSEIQGLAEIVLPDLANVCRFFSTIK